MKYVKYKYDIANEQEWLEHEPTKSLRGAVVMIPEGITLSDEAIETIRHFRYYSNAQDGFVLLSDRVVVMMDVSNTDEMIRQATDEADTVMSCMPDFAPYNMDDDCGVLHMTNAKVFAFRPFKIDTGALAPALEARQDCLEACEKREIMAVVYCDAKEFA